MDEECCNSDSESVYDEVRKPLQGISSSLSTHSCVNSGKDSPNGSETFGFADSDFNCIDLNKEVDFIVNSKPIESLLEEGVIIEEGLLAELQVNKRSRKTKEQVLALKEEYLRSQDWDKQDIDLIAIRLGMSAQQVYKWLWDQKKKSVRKQRDAKKAQILIALRAIEF